MVRKKLTNGWIRDTSEETGSVLFWYEKKDITASIVETNFPNEAEYRISSNKFSIESRGDKNLIKRKSDSQRIKKIEALIRRERYR